MLVSVERDQATGLWKVTVMRKGDQTGVALYAQEILMTDVRFGRVKAIGRLLSVWGVQDRFCPRHARLAKEIYPAGETNHPVLDTQVEHDMSTPNEAKFLVEGEEVRHANLAHFASGITVSNKAPNKAKTRFGWLRGRA